MQVAKVKEDGSSVLRERRVPTVLHCDIIKQDPFWSSRPQLLE